MRRPSQHSWSEIAVIVGTPAAGGGLAVRRGEEAAAQPAMRWKMRMEKGQVVPMLVLLTPKSESTPGVLHRLGELEDRDFCIAPVVRKDLQAALLQIDKMLKLTKVVQVTHLPYLPYRPRTIF